MDTIMVIIYTILILIVGAIAGSFLTFFSIFKNKKNADDNK